MSFCNQRLPRVWVWSLIADCHVVYHLWTCSTTHSDFAKWCTALCCSCMGNRTVWYRFAVLRICCVLSSSRGNVYEEVQRKKRRKNRSRSSSISSNSNSKNRSLIAMCVKDTNAYHTRQPHKTGIVLNTHVHIVILILVVAILIIIALIIEIVAMEQIVYIVITA